ncbi:MAG: 50S ribosomal protein L9 [Parvularculaceae bacterium]
MEVILLERVERLGSIGDTVSVKAGFARNFLLPKGKALRSTNANRAVFEAQREQIEARNAEARDAATNVGTDLDGNVYVLIRQASDMGVLYGSVSSRDIAEVATADGHKVERAQVVLDKPLKSLGIHDVKVVLHPEVFVTMQVNIARTEDEAAAQARGEDVLARKDDIPDEDRLETTEMFEDEDDAPAPEADAEAETEDDA